VNKAEVIQAQVVVSNGKTVLLGVCKYIDDVVNFKVPFSWAIVQTAEDDFIDELRESLAKELDIAKPKVDVKREHLLRKMREGTFEAIFRGYI